MRKVSQIVFLAIFLVSGRPVSAGPHLKGIKIAVTNPSSDARPGADVVISVSDIRKAAPDFTPGAAIVTATDAATVEEDTAILQAQELPSQVDDLDGDGKADELAFQIDLSPHQTRVVTISYGDLDRIWRLRNEYAPRTNALFSRKFEGLGWESEQIGRAHV